MRPKGKLFALLAIFAAIGLVTASGAFTTVQADRTANVQVNGDNAALISIDEPTDNASAATVVDGDTGEVTFDLGNSSAGLNENATTTLTPIGEIGNNGNEDVVVSISISGTPSGWSVTAVNNDNSSDFSSLGTTARTISPGESIQFGLVMNVPPGAATQSFTFTIEIDAEDSNA